MWPSSSISQDDSILLCFKQFIASWLISQPENSLSLNPLLRLSLHLSFSLSRKSLWLSSMLPTSVTSASCLFSLRTVYQAHSPSASWECIVKHIWIFKHSLIPITAFCEQRSHEDVHASNTESPIRQSGFRVHSDILSTHFSRMGRQEWL